MKIHWWISFAFSLLFLLTSVAHVSAATNKIELFVNGTKLLLHQPPTFKQGHVMIPIRAIAESVGATVRWNSNKRTVTVSKKDQTILFQINSTSSALNGLSLELPVPPFIQGGRTFVPLKTISAFLQANLAITQTQPNPDISAYEYQFHITHIQFINHQDGWAVGNGFLLGTSNGEQQWELLNVEPYTIIQLDFINRNEGWIVASNGNKTKLLHTVDGGKSLENLPVPQEKLLRTHFLNSQIGFAYYAKESFITRNGGKTWSLLSLPKGALYASFINAKHGWAIIMKDNAIDTTKLSNAISFKNLYKRDAYELFETKDGGDTWMLKTKIPTFDSEGKGGVITARNAKDVWIILEGGYGMSQHAYSVFHTDDEGQSWKQLIYHPSAGAGPAPGINLHAPLGPGGQMYGMTMLNVFDDDNAFLYGIHFSGHPYPILGVTHDEGEHWSNKTLNMQLYPEQITFINKNIGWIVDDHSFIYKTLDGGESWTQQYPAKN